MSTNDGKTRIWSDVKLVTTGKVDFIWNVVVVAKTLEVVLATCAVTEEVLWTVVIVFSAEVKALDDTDTVDSEFKINDIVDLVTCVVDCSTVDVEYLDWTPAVVDKIKLEVVDEFGSCAVEVWYLLVEYGAIVSTDEGNTRIWFDVKLLTTGKVDFVPNVVDVALTL